MTNIFFAVVSEKSRGFEVFEFLGIWILNFFVIWDLEIGIF